MISLLLELVDSIMCKTGHNLRTTNGFTIRLGSETIYNKLVNISWAISMN